MSTDDLFKFPMPDIGEGVAEGEIVAWMVKPGDAIKEDDHVLDVMTDKATVDITSPVEGTIEDILVAEGDVVPVGTILYTARLAEGAHMPQVAVHGDHAEEAPAPAAPEPEAAPVAAVAVEEFVRPDGQRALATPHTRKLARTLGVDIETVRGTGDIGRVTPSDVESFAAAATAPAVPAPVAVPPPGPAAAPPPITPVPGGETRVPIRGLRKVIFERMQMSKSMAAHFTYVEEVDATELVAMRTQMKAHAAERGVKLTYLPFIMKAVVSAFRKFPTLNGVTDDGVGEFVIKHDFNFGIAVDTEAGLIVPVVRAVDQRSILELAQEVERVATDARVGRSKLDDLSGGTFTITNAGNIGGLLATPIINYPEAAILGVHAIKRKPWVVGDEIKIRDIMVLSISVDHRVNDGATAAYFMKHVVSLLEAPTALVLEL